MGRSLLIWYRRKLASQAPDQFKLHDHRALRLLILEERFLVDALYKHVDLFHGIHDLFAINTITFQG